MPKLAASVGKGGVNRAEDVRMVQQLLNQNVARLTPLLPSAVSGICDASTIMRIEHFQRQVLRIPRPDGRVDPNGRTLTALMGAHLPGSATEPVISGNALPLSAAKILKEILKSAGVVQATVTSVSRTPAEQARVMYENCVSKGAAFNKRMYAAAGDRVVDVYTANKDKPRDQVIALMLAKIREVGPTHVSKHISDSHYTFDVAPTSIPLSKHADFLAAIKAHQSVSKVICPPVDPAFHIEIPKNSVSLRSR